MPFPGSYASDDVTFLMNPITVESPTADFSALPQGIDYRTLVDSEEVWSPQYMDFFGTALDQHKRRIAMDTAQVARRLSAISWREVVIVSLVRAGTPVGVLLHRALDLLGHKNVHYSISATRKRGADPSSLDYILQRHEDRNIVFVDGWTGKGFIAGELSAAVSSYNQTRGTKIKPDLAVLSDLAGVAKYSASADDYLIPAAMLRSTVCGLISASMLNPTGGSGEIPDACIYYKYLADHDVSRLFVDTVSAELPHAVAHSSAAYWDDQERAEAKAVSSDFVAQMMRDYGITEVNHIKPGICEANRALLTRNAAMTLLVRNPIEDCDDLANLHFLAERKGVKVLFRPDMPYRAAVLLKA